MFDKIHTHASEVFHLVHVARGLSSKLERRWKVLHVSLFIVSCVAYLFEHDSEKQLNTKHIN